MKRLTSLVAVVAVLAVAAVVATLSASADSGRRHGDCSPASTRPASWQAEHCLQISPAAGSNDNAGTSGGQGAQSMSSGVTGSSPQPATTQCDQGGVSGLDIVWLKTSVQGDIFEIQGGQMALAKSTNPAVRLLAQTLIDDHTKSLQDAKEIAAEYGITLPTDPTPEQQWILDELGEYTGPAFDNEYSEVEVKDHEQDIDETKDEVQLGCDTETRQNAQEDLPVLQKHLQLAQAALQASPEVPEQQGATSSTTEAG